MNSRHGFDYVIVGAGSAGCVLASRLTEDPSCRVLLLEAGPEPTDPVVPMPGATFLLEDSPIDWGFRTVPQPFLNNRRIPLARGRALGGSGSINGCLYVRGNRGNFDGWAQSGATGWDYDSVLPYFMRSEDSRLHSDAFHGTGGAMAVENFAPRSPLQPLFLEAMEGMGVARNPDFNGEVQEGCGLYQGTLRDGRRESTYTAFLEPALGRENLAVVTHALVLRLVIENGRCTGLDYFDGRGARRATADTEVLLAAGAIGSPHILLLSGIGPADRLAEHGIDVHAALAGVGENLADHVAQVSVGFTVKDPERWGFEAMSHDEAVARFERDRTGPLADWGLDHGAFVRLREVDEYPDAQLFFSITNSERMRHTMPPGCLLGGYVCQPRSRGRIWLASANPMDRPLIDPRYYESPDDLEGMLEIVEFAGEVMASPVFDAVRDKPLRAYADRLEILAAIKAMSGTCWHQCGTCRMGTDDRAVVAPDLKVHGIEALRVADASIMPTITSGNTNAPTIMLAEKAADLVTGSA